LTGTIKTEIYQSRLRCAKGSRQVSGGESVTYNAESAGTLKARRKEKEKSTSNIDEKEKRYKLRSAASASNFQKRLLAAVLTLLRKKHQKDDKNRAIMYVYPLNRRERRGPKRSTRERQRGGVLRLKREKYLGREEKLNHDCKHSADSIAFRPNRLERSRISDVEQK